MMSLIRPLALAVFTRAAASTPLPYPRGAVSCVLRLATEPPRYLLVRRGRPPNKGAWSLPGGKLELGESAVAGAVREISEETSLPPAALKVHPRPITATDAIVPNDAGGFLYHYCIVQCFAWVDAEYEDRVMPGDDAAQACAQPTPRASARTMRIASRFDAMRHLPLGADAPCGVEGGAARARRAGRVRASPVPRAG